MYECASNLTKFETVVFLVGPHTYTEDWYSQFWQAVSDEVTDEYTA